MSDADELDKKLKQLAEIDMKRAVAQAIQTVKSAAVNNCGVDTGELRQSIYAEVTGDRNLLDQQSLCSVCGVWYWSERSGRSRRHFSGCRTGLYAVTMVDS